MNITNALVMHLKRFFFKTHGGLSVSLKHSTLRYKLIKPFLGNKRECKWGRQDWQSFRDFTQVIFIHKEPSKGGRNPKSNFCLQMLTPWG